MIDEWNNGAKYWNFAWNPMIGCRKISEGCANCYAERLAMRYPELRSPNGKFDPHCPKTLKRPPQKGVVFVGNMTDIFGEWNDWPQILDWLLRLHDSAENLILTKRPERMAKLIAGINPARRAWRGTTAENQQRYDERVKFLKLIQSPFVKTWLSLEPLLGPVNLLSGGDADYLPFDWVVIGSEPGNKLLRRPCEIEWVRGIVRQCGENNIPVFVKQLEIDGELERDIRKFPEDLQIRQLPWGK